MLKARFDHKICMASVLFSNNMKINITFLDRSRSAASPVNAAPSFCRGTTPPQNLHHTCSGKQGNEEKHTLIGQRFAAPPANAALSFHRGTTPPQTLCG
jgi:hypothetical protein